MISFLDLDETILLVGNNDETKSMINDVKNYHTYWQTHKDEQLPSVNLIRKFLFYFE